MFSFNQRKYFFINIHAHVLEFVVYVEYVFIAGMQGSLENKLTRELHIWD